MADTHFITSKRCSKCGDEKPLSEFSKHKNGPGGLRSSCKACCKLEYKSWVERNSERKTEYNKKWYDENVELARSLSRDWYRRNAEHVKDVARQYREANRDLLKEKYRLFYEQNKDRARSWNKAWMRRNKERRKQYVILNADRISEKSSRWSRENKVRRNAITRNYKARKRNAEGSHTHHDVASLLKHQKGRCACCKEKLKKYHVDHVVALATGGSNDPLNLQILCPRCNTSKGARDPISFMQENGYLL